MKDELYVDIVSKTIISKLSEEISANISKQIIEAMRGVSAQEIGELVSAKIRAEMEPLVKTISESENSYRLHADNSAGDIKRYVDDRLRTHIKPDYELRDFIRDEMSGVRDALKRVESYDSIKGMMESQVASITSKTQGLIDNFRKSVFFKSGDVDGEMRKYIEEIFNKEKMILFDHVATIKDELAELRHVLFGYVQRLEAEAAMHSEKRTEFEKKIKELQDIWERSSSAGDSTMQKV
jgi:hypothetical protein